MTNDCDVDVIDLIQYSTAHLKFPEADINGLSGRDFYDHFLRPLDQLVAVGTPLAAWLQRACCTADGTEDFTQLLCRIAGFRRVPDTLPARLIVEEMSKVRVNLPHDFIRIRTTDAPLNLCQPVKLADTDHRV